MLGTTRFGQPENTGDSVSNNIQAHLVMEETSAQGTQGDPVAVQISNGPVMKYGVCTQ
jgi:hypothetical protein